MNKILIIGIPGSGKSTFANKLGKELNREIIHLDKFYYKSNWVAVQKDEWSAIVKNLLSREEWIMDGNYRGTFDSRIPAADTVVFLNFNKILCIYRAFTRSLDKNQPFDKAEGNTNKLSWGLLKKIITFNREEVIYRLKLYENTKKIFIVNNRKELDEVFSQLTTS